MMCFAKEKKLVWISANLSKHVLKVVRGSVIRFVPVIEAVMEDKILPEFLSAEIALSFEILFCKSSFGVSDFFTIHSCLVLLPGNSFVIFLKQFQQRDSKLLIFPQ